ncbi:MAG: Fic family protein, partial [Cyanobium sp.]
MPRKPPSLQELLERCGGLEEALPLLSRLATEVEGERYLHWDELRHQPPPQGLSHEQWWLAEKLSRRRTPLPLLASDGQPFWFSQPPLLLQALHEIDRKAGAGVVAPEAVTTRSTLDRYLL